MKIDFIDLGKQQEKIRLDVNDRIAKVLAHGKYIMGPEVLELEESLAEYVGVKHCITCSSGTDALLMALMSKGIGPGDAIITSPFTFIASAEVISLLGAKPYFVDIRPNDFNIDADKVDDTLNKILEEGLRPKGIIAVDMFGQPSDYDKLNKIAEFNNLFVIQDGAQSFGATYKSRKAGSLSEIATTSFFPAKPFGCYGDGGAVFCDNDDIAEVLKSIRVHGKGLHKYDNVRIGINGRLDTIQAAILLSKLNVFEEEISLRSKLADYYNSKITSDKISLPILNGHNTSAWAQYSILYDDRNELQDWLKNKEIPTQIYYPIPLHLSHVYKTLGYKKGDFPVSELISGKILSLPFYPYMDYEEVDYIISHINSFLSKQ